MRLLKRWTGPVETPAAIDPNARDYVYVMQEVVIKAQSTPDEIRQSDEIREAYLGI